MNLKEHLQFLIMMIPTLLLLTAVAASLAFPAQSAGAPSVGLALAASLAETEAAIAQSPAGAIRNSVTEGSETSRAEKVCALAACRVRNTIWYSNSRPWPAIR